ncbi:RNA polymerase I-specific transcription initiation factor-domain-containing protein [Xylariaceae sp. FL1651]|nr:RNA polymerase I-specific transcription initiation factor-domain-containing protein [Xylariaceae sp. FL1651]
MESAEDITDDYLPDSDESNDEDERPNRWAGPPSTWQQLNSAEIDTLTALNELRNRDLSIHLYNAFMLKHRHENKGAQKTQNTTRPKPNQDINVATGQPVQDDEWVPPKSWTAWPMSAHTVPRPDFMKRADGVDERLIFRKQVQDMPSTDLEETMSAAVLRFAKEKFQARPGVKPGATLAQSGAESSDEGSNVHMSSASSRSGSRPKSLSRSRSAKYESMSDGERTDTHDSSRGARYTHNPLTRRFLKPVVATDDELSYTLLRPSVRQILGKLDATLTILHNAQESIANYQSDSADSDASDASSRSRRPSRGSSLSSGRKRGRPRKLRGSSQVRESLPPKTPAKEKKRAGQPRKVYPRLDGETDKEYVIRVARLKKKPIPFFPDDDPEPPSDSTPAPDSAAEYPDDKSRPKVSRARAQLRGRRQSSEALSDDTSTSEPRTKSLRKSKIGLRDWRDVLGAAALAGFPAPALDRAARRCADLFGQNFTLHTLQEGPTDQAKSLKEHVRYDPGMTIPSLLEDAEGDGDNDEPSRTLRAPSTAASTSDDERRPGRGRSTSVSRRSRSQSRSVSAGGAYFCIMSDCPRAVEPFSRLPNLMRHLKLVHHYEGDEVPMEVDSEDEMHGAVHVDGFLKPIKMRSGWRGGDTAKDQRRPRGRGRSRRRDVRDEHMEDQEMRDADSAAADGETSE